MITYIKIIFYIFIIFNTQTCVAWSLFNNYEKNKPQENIELLHKQQVDRPYDPEVNYNLGVALYNNKNFQDAQANFARALEHAGDHEILKKQAIFNLGNSCYKTALSMLPKNWQKKDSTIGPETLDKAFAQVQEAVKQYKSLLDINPEDIPAQTNEKKAQEIIKKIQKKKHEQEQKKQDDKKDDKKQEDKQNDKKDDKKQDKKDDKKKEDKKDDKQKQDDKNQESGKQDQDKNEQSEGQEKDQTQEGKEGEKKSERKDDAEKSPEAGQQGDDEKLDHDQAKDKEQKDSDHKDSSNKDQKSDTQDKQSEDTVGDAGKQEQEKLEHTDVNTDNAGDEEKYAREGHEGMDEGIEKRAMRAVLESLQADESKNQKNMILRKTNTGRMPESGQKPW